MAAALLPSGFLLALLANQGGVVVPGLFVFGAAHGIAYYQRPGGAGVSKPKPRGTDRGTLQG